MPSNKIQCVLGIQADTSQAKKQIADLYKSLQGVEKLNLDLSGLDADVVKAAEAADKLTSHLRAAVNVDTGKLNLIKLNQSIKESGDSLSTLVNNLSYGGQIGQQAFEQLATAISKTEVPLKTMNATLSSALTTLQNTIKWQLSSNIVHGLQGAFSGAVSYAQDLNKTLTDIRIVTGMSVDDMAKFADNANKAAKELSATTKAYADASLIYYQQGDSAELAAKKAATTIKAANVAFTASAKEMSEMLTAVWNSYQVGANQLESVVDVMANLGAKTASSMEEMATAMQKVAATANTVGVSMKQMSAIVATSASVTRQAPETIGTAWNTILSRIGGLKLGNTLEDGVDLNKYSSALATVGVNILDATGELREMGGVIDELGAKWQTLSSGQKAALAQTIGGARQYTQIMAFFENFDKYQQNMGFANNSQGALQQQQEIYAQGWEAASKRVRAAMEGIYSGLIDDQAIIKATNNIASIVNGLSSFIKTLGGAKGVVSAFGSVLLSVFSDRLGAQLKNIGNEVKNIFVDPKKQFETAYNEMRDEIQMNADATNSTSMSYQLDLLDVKKELLAKEQYLSDAQKATINNAIEGYTNQINKLHELETALNDVTKMNENHEKAFNNVLQSAVTNGIIDQQKQSQLSTTYDITKNNLLVSNIADYFPDITELNKFGDNLEAKIQSITGTFESLKTAVASSGEQTWIDALNKFDLKNLDDTKLKSLVQTIQQIGKEASQTGEHALQSLRQQIDALPDGTQKQTLIALFDDLREQLNSAAQASINFNQANAKTENTLDKLKQKLQSFPTTFNKIVEGVSKAGSAMLALSRVSASFNNVTVTMRDSTAKLSDKLGALGSAATSAGMAFATLKQALNFLGGPAAIVLSLIGTVATAAYNVYQGNQIADQQDREEKAKKSYERATGLEEENKAASDAYATYRELEIARRKSNETTDDYLNALDTVLEAFKIEQDSVDKTAQRYDNLAESIKNVNKERLDSAAKESMNAARDAITASKLKNQYNLIIDNAKDQEILKQLGFTNFQSLNVTQPNAPMDEYKNKWLYSQDSDWIEKQAVEIIKAQKTSQTKGLYNGIVSGIDLAINDSQGNFFAFDGSRIGRDSLNLLYDKYGGPLWEQGISDRGQQLTNDEIIDWYNNYYTRDINAGASKINTASVQYIEASVEEIDDAILNHVKLNTNAAVELIAQSDILDSNSEFQTYVNNEERERLAGRGYTADFIAADKNNPYAFMSQLLSYDYVKNNGYFDMSADSIIAADKALGEAADEQTIATFKLAVYRHAADQLANQLIGADESTINDAQIESIVKQSLGIAENANPGWLNDVVLNRIFNELPNFLDSGEVIKRVQEERQETIAKRQTFNWSQLGEKYNNIETDKQLLDQLLTPEQRQAIDRQNKLQTLYTDAIAYNGATTKEDLKNLIGDDEEYKQLLNTIADDNDIFNIYQVKQTILNKIQDQMNELGITSDEAAQLNQAITDSINNLFNDFQKNIIPNVLKTYDTTPEQEAAILNSVQNWGFNDYQDATQITAFWKKGEVATGLLESQKEIGENLGLIDAETGEWTELSEQYVTLLRTPFVDFQKSLANLTPQMISNSDDYIKSITSLSTLSPAAVFGLKSNPSNWKTEDYAIFQDQALKAGLDPTNYLNMNNISQQEFFLNLQKEALKQARIDKVDQKQLDLYGYAIQQSEQSLNATKFQNGIKPYQEALSALSSEVQNIVSGKGISATTGTILQRLGIDSSSIKTIGDFKSQITNLSSEIQNKLKDDKFANINTILEELKENGGDLTQLSPEDQQLITEWEALNTLLVQFKQILLDTTDAENANIMKVVADNIKAAKVEADELTKSIEKLQSVLSGMNDTALKTGQLSEVTKNLMSPEMLNAWNQATTYSQRANVKASVVSQLTKQQADEIDFNRNNILLAQQELQNFYKNGFSSKVFTNNIDKQWDIQDFAPFLKNLSGGAASAFQDAFNSAIEKTPSLKFGNLTDLTKAIQQELADKKIELDFDLSQVEAEARDTIHEIYAAIGDEEKAIADQAVDTWLKAFNTIADARQKLLKGESLLEDVAQNPEKFAELARASGLSGEQFAEAVLNGTLSADQLSRPDFDLNARRQQSGLDLLQFMDENGNLVGYQFHGQTVRNKVLENHPEMQVADENGNIDINATNASIVEYLKDRWGETLKATNSDINTDEDVIKLLNKYIGSDEKARAEAEKKILDMAKAQESNIQGEQKVLDAWARHNENISERDRQLEDKERELQQADDLAAQYTQYQDLASTISQDWVANGKGNKSIQEYLAGGEISEQQLLDLVNQAGYEYKNLNEIEDETVWDQVAAYYQQMAQEQYQVAQNTQSEIIGIYDAFLQKTKEKFGENSEQVKDAMQDLEDATFEGEQTNKGRQASIETGKTNLLENYSKPSGMSNAEFQEYMKSIQEANGLTTDFNKLSEAQQKQLAATARESLRAAEGWESLYNSQKDNIKAVKEGNVANESYRKGVKSLATDLKKVFGNSSAVTEQFVKDHIDDIEKMSKGDKKAAESVERALLQSQAQLENWGANLIDTNKSGGIQDELNGIIDQLNSFGDQYADMPIGFEVTANTDPALQAFDSLLQSGQMTAEQITAALNTIGWEPEIVYQEALVEDKQGMGVGGQIVTNINGQQVIGTIEGYEEGTGLARISYPTLKSAKKTGGGASGAPAAPKSSGGGGGGKEHKKKDPIRPQDEIERYHEIRDQIEKLGNALDRVDKLKTKTFGGKHLDALKEEIALLKQENGLQQEYYAEAARYLAADRADLMHYGAATFNADGTVNYEEYMQNIIAEVNRRFAASESDEEDEAAQQWYEDAKKALENYEEALDLVDTTQNDILENLNEISALTLEAAQYKLEIRVDLNDSDIEILDYYISKWEKMLSQQDESMEASIGQVYKYEDSLAALGDTFSELIYAHNMGDLNDSDFVEGLKDVRDQVFDTLGSINDLQNTIAEWYGQTLDKAEEELDKYTNKLSHSRDVMQTYIEMQQLMGKGADYRALSNMYTFAYESSLENAKAAREYVDILKEAREVILQQVEEYGWTDTLKQQFDDVEAHIIEAENTLLENTQQTLEDAKAEFENTISAIIKELDNAFETFKDANGNLKTSFSEVADEYSYWTEEQGWYVSTAKELYEVSKINRKIEDSIAGATTQQSKERLKLLQDEINAYAEKNRLTEYDIKMNELQYEMALAMQGLEDAGNNKQTVRLTRDENGNYGYQYTADQDEMDAARQKYEDVLQQINELSDEYQKEMMQRWIDAEEEFRTKIEEILTDESHSMEERIERAKAFEQQHLEALQYYHDEYNKASEQLLTNQEYVQQHYGESIMQNTHMVQDQLNITVGQMINETDRYKTYINEQAFPQIEAAMEIYKGDLDATKDATKLSWEAMGKSVNDYRGINQLARQDIQNTDQVLRNTLSGISNATAKWLEHSNSLRTTITSYESLGNSINGIISKLNSATSAANTAASAIRNMQNASYSSYSGGGGSGSSGGGSGSSGSPGGSKSPAAVTTAPAKSSNLGGYTPTQINTFEKQLLAKRSAGASVLAKQKTYKAASGGLDDVTGWHWLDGTLQRPELVLNADDTQNMLKMVNILHNLSPEMLSALHGTINGSAYTMLAGLGGAMSAHSINSTNSELNQNVEIHADFPNVTDKNEIVEAFDNLVNLATQYANRKG